MAIMNIIPAALNTAKVADAKAWAYDNGKWIADVIAKHKSWLSEAQVEKYQAAYDGYLEEIEDRDKNRGDNINNKINPNYAAVVIDAVVDYMTGKPILWTIEDTYDTEKAKQTLIDDYRKELKQLLDGEQSQRVLSEQLRQGCIAGYGAVISWVDENGKIDYEEFPANEVVPVYDARGRLKLVLRYYDVEDPQDGGEVVHRTRVEVYDDKYLTYYISNDSEGYELDSMELDDPNAEEPKGNPVEHKAGRIPVSIFVNATAARYETRLKRAGTSDLGNGVLSLLINYANGISDKANLVEYLLDQYLLLIGVDTEEDEVIKMRKARALLLKGDKNVSDARFIAQSQDDNAVENHLNRIKDSIYDTTFTPKLNDLQGATATEIKMKYAALDIKAGKKELYFVAAVRHFIQVLTDMINARRLTEAGVEDIYAVLAGKQTPPASVVLYNAEWVTPTLVRNLPQNFKEIADIVAELSGKVPDSYLIELLWFIDDPVKALEEMKAQKTEEAKANLAAMGYGTEFQDTTGEGSSTAGNTTGNTMLDSTIKDVSLNGAQINSLIQIVQAVAKNELPRASALAMLTSAFPFDDVKAEEILDKAGQGFTIATTTK